MVFSGVDLENPPPFLPPRRPSSLPNLTTPALAWNASIRDSPSTGAYPPPPFLRSTPPSFGRRQLVAGNERPDSESTLDGGDSRPQSFQSFLSSNTAALPESGLQRAASNGSEHLVNHHSKIRGDIPIQTPGLEVIRDDVPSKTELKRTVQRASSRWSVLRQSSLRVESRLSEEDLSPPLPPALLGTSHSDGELCPKKPRPYSDPTSRVKKNESNSLNRADGLQARPSHRELDPGSLSTLPISRSSTSGSQKTQGPRPTPSFVRLSSLDNLITYREEKAEWKRASRASFTHLQPPCEQEISCCFDEQVKVFDGLTGISPSIDETINSTEDRTAAPEDSAPGDYAQTSRSSGGKFRHFAAEVGFCFTIAMTQFLAEYLISGFAIELPIIISGHITAGSGSMGLFWPACLLSLILSATLLFFARLSDMYSGYFIFMFGLAWLAIWTLIPGFCRTAIWIDVSRAMQGLAIASFMPSTFAMVGSVYPEGPRRNFVMGLYSGCAPLGFFAGFLVAGALPDNKAQWYFWIASIAAAATFVTAFLSVPSDRTDRRKLGLKMDWIGSFLTIVGLILLSYALAVEPYANQSEPEKSGFAFPIVIGPFVSGICCLAVAFCYEGWVATCPLLPFDFFKPKCVKSFSLACLCFYASYGVWLYNSAQYFSDPSGTSTPGTPDFDGIALALWYTPTAVGGVVLCIVGGALMHIVPIMILLLCSALAWIAAPLLLALAPLPLQYWSFVVPSMLCATLGIDLTFTISIVFLSSVQPLRYQGLAGAVCSIFVNLAMSFALSISEIVMRRAESTKGLADNTVNWGFRAAFLYAAASAGLGLIICLSCVRLSRSMVKGQPADEERPRPTSSDSTLVGNLEEQHPAGNN